MSKGNRIRKQHAQEPVRMSKGTFKAFLWNVLDNADDASYNGLQALILKACGVINREGKLTPEYESSPFWKLEGNVLVPSEHTKLIGELTRGAKEQGKYKPCKVCGKQPEMFSVENIESGDKSFRLACTCGRSTAFFADKDEAVNKWESTN